MNNKKLGTAFERKMCELLAKDGWWVHFLSPDERGAQPFDIIAVKGDSPMAIDCKTCESGTFRLERLEDNQVMAFEKWIACGNSKAYIAVLHKNKVYLIYYSHLKAVGKVKLDGMGASYDGVMV